MWWGEYLHISKYWRTCIKLLKHCSHNCVVRASVLHSEQHGSILTHMYFVAKIHTLPVEELPISSQAGEGTMNLRHVVRIIEMPFVLRKTKQKVVSPISKFLRFIQSAKQPSNSPTSLLVFTKNAYSYGVFQYNTTILVWNECEWLSSIFLTFNLSVNLVIKCDYLSDRVNSGWWPTTSDMSLY